MHDSSQTLSCARVSFSFCSSLTFFFSSPLRFFLPSPSHPYFPDRSMRKPDAMSATASWTRVSGVPLVLVSTLSFLVFSLEAAFSVSFVYQDQLAMPQFGVRILHDLIPASDLHPQDGYIMMTGPQGRRWACTIPTVPTETMQGSIAKSSEVLEQEDRDSIQRGLSVIEPLSHVCLQTVRG